MTHGSFLQPLSARQYQHSQQATKRTRFCLQRRSKSNIKTTARYPKSSKANLLPQMLLLCLLMLVPSVASVSLLSYPRCSFGKYSLRRTARRRLLVPWNLSRDILLPDRHPLLPRVQEQAVLQLRRDHLVKYFGRKILGKSNSFLLLCTNLCLFKY